MERNVVNGWGSRRPECARLWAESQVDALVDVVGRSHNPSVVGSIAYVIGTVMGRTVPAVARPSAPPDQGISP